MIRLVFLILAFLLFLGAGLGVTYRNFSLGWLGLAALTIGVWLPNAQ
jgi:hypothetical protein